jgi:hypothetical protein
MTPAMTSVAGWAAELTATVVQDIADNMLPASAFSQLSTLGLRYLFVQGTKPSTSR